MLELESLVNASWASTAQVALVLGVLFHQAIRPLDVDNYGWHFVFTFLGSFWGLVFMHVNIGAYTILGALVRTTCIAALFNTGLFSSMVIYRIFFHRLRHFPGPFWGKITAFRRAYLVVRTQELYLYTHKYHEKYGDFVRVAPRWISINRASAIPLLYGPSSNCQKDVQYRITEDGDNHSSLQNVKDPELHRQRKKVWEQGLSYRALAIYEPRIQAMVDKLLSDFATGRPVDVTDRTMCLTFDIIGDLGFSKDFGMLSSGKEHDAIRDLRHVLNLVAVGRMIPWTLNMLNKVPSGRNRVDSFREWCRNELRKRQEAWGLEKASSNIEDPRDIATWLIKARDEGDRSGAPTERALDEDSVLLLGAGSETTSITMTTAMYFLGKHPQVYRKLQSLLEEAFPGGEKDWTYAKAKDIEYVDWIINETMRLRPPGLNGAVRETPPEGLQVDEVFIPGNTIVGVPIYTIQRDPRYWDSPDSFIPERWENRSTETSPWLAFQRGIHRCVGKSMAMMELRSVLSRTALRYDIAFAPGGTDERFEKDSKDLFTTRLPPLQMIFTPK
ncbi:cytochrome P450 [Thozetella sp. PMI_491]|nr:cytochrome P450 [Thozetella sp. PMI_491]